MLRDASDMTLTQQGSQLNVRITNQSGHKLPTGVGGGRRAWINVRFLAANGSLVAERGAYNMATAAFDGSDKVGRAAGIRRHRRLTAAEQVE